MISESGPIRSIAGLEAQRSTTARLAGAPLDDPRAARALLGPGAAASIAAWRYLDIPTRTPRAVPHPQSEQTMP
jgi:hypothetical protein